MIRGVRAKRTQDITKIYFDAPDGINFYWRERATNTEVAMMPAHSARRTPISSSPSSSAWYYANVLLPNRAAYPDSWYVFGWADTNNDATPDTGDTFAVLAHGL